MSDSAVEDSRENITAEELRSDILSRLDEFGFVKQDDGTWIPPKHDDKKKKVLKKIHGDRLKTWLLEHEEWIRENEERYLKFFADGCEIEPSKISPRLVRVDLGSPPQNLFNYKKELNGLFRYAKYHWSLPVKQGWGRGIRYLVMDEYHQKIIGIFGLTDPVFNLSSRDQWIGWSTEEREKRLKRVFDAYVLGAMPPYNDLLGGKLVASLACSNEVREDIREKYAGKESLISGETLEGEVVLITTTSAWGKSSMLSRLQYHDRLMWEHIGWTSGFGHFHLDSGLADQMKQFLKQENDVEVTKNDAGDGPSPKLRYMRSCLNRLDIDQSVLEHGIQRGFYAAKLASNFDKVLCNGASPEYFDMPAEDIYSFFKTRYLLGRAERIDRWRDYDSNDAKLVPKLNSYRDTN